MRTPTAGLLLLIVTGALCSTLTVAATTPSAPAAEASGGPLSALPYTPSLDTSAMDRTAKPCQDFYQYSCGGWRTRNPIPPDQSGWSVYGKLYEDNQRLLWGILGNLSQAGAERSANQQKIGDYFAACTDEAAIAQRGVEPLKPLLARIDGLHSKGELPALLADLHLDLGSSGLLFGFGSSQDFADSNQVIAFASAGGLGLPDRDYYTDQDTRARKLRAQYLDHVTRMFALLGDSAKTAAHDAAIVMRIETQLARARLTRVELREPHNLFHKLGRSQLQRLTPDFGWDAYLKELGLEKFLVYDRWLRHTFRLFVFDPSLKHSDYEALALHEHAGLAGGEFTVSSSSAHDAELTHEVQFVLPDAESVAPIALRATKRFSFGPAPGGCEIACEVELKLEAPVGRPVAVGLESVVNLLAPGTTDRFFETPSGRQDLRFSGTLPGPALRMEDGWQRVRIALNAPGAEQYWIAPIETVSESEEGFERVYQGSQMLAVWYPGLSGQTTWTGRLIWRIEKF